MLTVRDLKFTYPNSENPTLNGLDFDIAKGEIFGFLGPSGAGKSTCQKILFQILKNYEGTIMVNKRDLKDQGKEYLSEVGVGFELPNHYLKLTGEENLKLFGSFYEKSRILPLENLFERVGLSDAMNKRVESYSKGMKMRLNFIRAIMHDPSILYFDEPTSGLDPNNAYLLKQEILELKKRGKTIFITTHDMTIADELCDRVAFIDSGEIKALDSPENLKQKHGKNEVEVELEDHSKRIFELNQLGVNKEFVEFINSKKIRSIHSQEATLEKVFIEVTGKRLKE